MSTIERLPVALARNDLDDQSLKALAERINSEHALVGQSLGNAIDHGIRVGEALLAARQRVPHGSWIDWVAENVDVSVQQALLYMRVARHQELLRRNPPPSLKAAGLMLRRTGVADQRVDPVLRAECTRLRGEGLTIRAIADELAVSRGTVGRWLDPAAEERYRRKAAKTSIAGRAALKRLQRTAAARRVGGDLGDGYATVRRALDILERVAADAPSRRQVRAAMHSLYAAEDSLAEAIRMEGATQA